jgi:hypothetical protein
MTTPAAAAESVNGPLKSVADAMSNAAAAIGDGAARVGEAMPATRRFASRFTYSLFYFTSYGVVFPTLFVASTVPGLGQAAAGLVEGANAASEAVNERKAKREERRAQRKAERAARQAARHDPDMQMVTQEGLEALHNC